MKTYETEIRINAPKEQVWATLMDHSNYANWNPLVVAISGDTQTGKQLNVKLQLENANPMDFQPVVLVNKHATEFRWLGKLFVKGVFDGEHYFKLEAVNEQETRFIHGEIFRGIFVRPMLALIGEKTLNGFKAMNEALKAEVER